VLSLPDGIGQVLRDHVANERDAAEAMEEDEPVYEYRALPLKVAHERERQEVRGKGDEALLDAQAQSRANTCPTCGERSLVYQEGCESCLACGYSRC
jgi:ribonucleoside-diphosphate reductase alpha chain